MSINYKEEVNGFERHLANHNAVIMPTEDNQYEICKIISQIKSPKYKMTSFDFSKIEPLFLSQIKILGKETKDFYQEKISKVRVKREGFLRNGDAQIYGFKGKQIIYATNKTYKDIDFIAYSHELGHIPSFETSKSDNKDYYEYLETLPMYFEYLACRTLDTGNAKKILLDTRLNLLKKEAQGYFSQKKQIKNNNSYADQFFRNGMIESYKYLKSFDFTLQLIDKADSDQQAVNNELDMYVTGEKTMREVAKSLSINTAGCTKLLKVAKNNCIFHK